MFSPIFEEKYKELVQDCLDNHASFAIPFFENGKISNFGCEVKIKSVLKSSPAEKAGLLPGDFILKINGIKILVNIMLMVYLFLIY